MNQSFYTLAFCLLTACGAKEVKENKAESLPETNLISEENSKTETHSILSVNEYMQLARIQCDSFLSYFFGSDNFRNHLRLNRKACFVNCESAKGTKIFHFGDSAKLIPRLYSLSYSIIQAGDTIYTFSMDGDNSMVFDFPAHDYWKGKFRAYRFLLNKDIRVSFKKARSTALKNGFTEHSVQPELEYDLKGDVNAISSYYWDLRPANIPVGKKARSLQIDINTATAKVVMLETREIHETPLITQ